MSAPSELGRRHVASVSWRGLLHLAVVYGVWSSTYLAIRVAVRPGAGFPPFTLGAVRCVVGGALLLAWMAWKGRRVRTSRPELLGLVVSGTLLWTTGNGLVLFAEQRVESALAALLLSSTPIWVALLEAWIDRQYPTPLLAFSLVLGFSGTALISAPGLRDGAAADPVSVLALLLGALSWGGGSLYQRRRHIGLDPVVSSGYQQLFGGAGMAVLALLSREPLPRPTPAAWAGFAYLLVFGSLLAFTSYLLALRLLPTRIVFTYAYVNPVIAVFLGWLVLGERIGGWTMAGAALVLVGVAGTFRARMQ
jgi:drug/metabolite transporter (DMT)-like permease